MAEATRGIRIETLKAAADAKKKEAHERTEQAIRRLALRQEPLSFRAVAREAGVSLSFLYKYSDIKQRIRGLVKQHANHGRKTTESRSSTNAMITHLRSRLKDLQAEVDEKNKRLASISAQLYELADERDLVARLREENQKLVERVRELEVASGVMSSSTAPLLQLPAALETELSRLDISLSEEARRKVLSYPEENIRRALHVVKEARQASSVRSPIRLFLSALEKGWAPSSALSSADAQEERRQFSEWFELARKTGRVTASRGLNGEIRVLTREGKWMAFSKLAAQPGWSLSELQSKEIS